MLSGLLQEGYATGNLLASVAYFLVFPHWGWRPLFFIGGLPALLAIFVRMRVKESEVWQRTRHHDFTSLFRAIVSQWRLFLYLTLLMACMNGVSHGTQDLYPTFLQRDWGMSPHMRSAINARWCSGRDHRRHCVRHALRPHRAAQVDRARAASSRYS